MDNKVYWIMMIAEMGCRACPKWNGKTDSAPCEGFKKISLEMEELECPEKGGRT